MRTFGLGHIIDRLRAVHPARVCRIGFFGPHSYRGDYSDLAFRPAENITVGQMLGAAEGAEGKTFEGYKGGQYEMDEHSRCWLSEYGRGGGEVIGPVMMSLILDEPLWKEPE